MSSVFRKTGISEQELKEITTIVFVKLAEMGELDEKVMREHLSLFEVWNEKWVGKANSIVVENGVLYQSNRDVTNCEDNVRPSESPERWACLRSDEEVSQIC